MSQTAHLSQPRGRSMERCRRQTAAHPCGLPPAEHCSPAHLPLCLRGLVPCAPCAEALWLASPAGHGRPRWAGTLPRTYFLRWRLPCPVTSSLSLLLPSRVAPGSHRRVRCSHPHPPEPSVLRPTRSHIPWCPTQSSDVSPPCSLSGPLPSASPHAADAHGHSWPLCITPHVACVWLAGSPPLPGDTLASDTWASPCAGHLPVPRLHAALSRVLVTSPSTASR